MRRIIRNRIKTKSESKNHAEKKLGNQKLNTGLPSLRNRRYKKTRSLHASKKLKRSRAKLTTRSQNKYHKTASTFTPKPILKLDQENFYDHYQIVEANIYKNLKSLHISRELFDQEGLDLLNQKKSLICNLATQIKNLEIFIRTNNNKQICSQIKELSEYINIFKVPKVQSGLLAIILPIYFHQIELKMVKQLADRAFKIGSTYNLIWIKLIGCEFKGKYLSKSENHESALKKFLKMLEYALISHSYKKEILSYELIAKEYYYLGELKKAEFYQTKHISLKTEPIGSRFRIPMNKVVNSDTFSNSDGEEKLFRWAGNFQEDLNSNSDRIISNSFSSKSKRNKQQSLSNYRHGMNNLKKKIIESEKNKIKVMNFSAKIKRQIENFNKHLKTDKERIKNKGEIMFDKRIRYITHKSPNRNRIRHYEIAKSKRSSSEVKNLFQNKNIPNHIAIEILVNIKSILKFISFLQKNLDELFMAINNSQQSKGYPVNFLSLQSQVVQKFNMCKSTKNKNQYLPTLEIETPKDKKIHIPKSNFLKKIQIIK